MQRFGSRWSSLPIVLVGLLLAVPLSTSAQAQNLQGKKGVVSVGTGLVPGSSGDFDSRQYGNDVGRAIQDAIFALVGAGGGVVEVLGGSYTLTTSFEVHTLPIELRFAPNAIVTVKSTGPIGVGRFTSTTASKILGGKFIVPQATNDQHIFEFQDTFRSVMRDVTIDFQAAGSASNPMIGVLAEDETEGTFDGITVLPATGVIGMRDLRGSGNVWDRCKVTNGLDQTPLSVVLVGRNVLHGFQAYDAQFVKLRDFRAWGLGTVSAAEVDGVVHWFASGEEQEDGHSVIESPHMELCAVQSYIKIEGCQGWVQVSNPQLGLGNYSIGGLGDAAIKVTRSTARVVASEASIQAVNSTSKFIITGTWTVTPSVGNSIVTSGFAESGNNGTFLVTAASSTEITVSGTLTDEAAGGDENVNISRNAARVEIHGGTIHNVGRSRASAEGLFFLTTGAAQGATPGGIKSGAVAVTGTNTFDCSPGTWASTPVAGQWVRTANFTNSGNNGNFKVVSADADEITVAATLTNESSTGNDELVVAAYPYEGSGIWLEYCSDVDVRDVRVVDQRHQWGISIDPTTVRGVIVDDVTFHKGTGSGAVAPIRIPTATLLNVGSGSGNLNDTEGIGIGAAWMKTWGATPVFVSDGSVTNTLGTAIPTITETSAPFLPGSLGDAATNYDKAGASVGTDDLSLVRRLN